MRALIDTNIYLSYLLGPGPDSAVREVVEAGVRGEYTILLPVALWEEMTNVVQHKTYFRHRISPQELQQLQKILGAFAELLPEMEEPIPRVVRDPKDDYLLAHAVLDAADYLVTGDADLLTLDPVGSLRIVTPRDFVKILREKA